MTEKHDYQNVIHADMETSCHLGHDLHVITSNAFDQRVLNLRLNRIIPSMTGHTGYTRIGFFLTKRETRELRDILSEVIENGNAWEIQENETIVDMTEGHE